MPTTLKQAIDSQQPHRLQSVPRRPWADNNPGDLQQPHDRPGGQALQPSAGHDPGLPWDGAVTTLAAERQHLEEWRERGR
jgi:hypothetical protein